jgi:hydroxypyruvate isomerase
MPKFAANLSMLFTEVPFLDRFERAARAGFDAVEFLFPYAFKAEEIRARLKGNGLTPVLHNLPPGDWEGGERGLACLPGRVDDFRASVALGLAYATALGVPQVHCMAGKAPVGVSHELLRQTCVANLRYAATEAQARGVKLLIEPINAHDMPGYFMNRTALALAVMDEVASDNLFLQYDLYHAQRSEGELAATISQHLARIAHIQIADNPGRHEPGTGEIHYPFLFAHLDRLGYRGHVGCEYRPAGGTEAGLAWLDTARLASVMPG